MLPGSSPLGFDLAVISFWMFLVFFAGLIWYLHRESKREGYPLAKDTQDRYNRYEIVGWPAPPPAKTYKQAHGADKVIDANGNPDTRNHPLKALEPWPGAPLEPVGDPMLAGVGPGSWAERADKPDILHSGKNRLEPLRVAKDFYVEGRDPNPVGMEVIGGDGKRAGVVKDIWIDRAEYVMRYMEIEVAVPGGFRNVLLPTNFTRIDGEKRQARVKAIFAKHFADVPGLKSPDQVTLLEEDKIMGYYGGGTLYASPQRSEPLI
jgi:photosynthetic reaction center H subunit